jgi:hypothetical protein
MGPIKWKCDIPNGMTQGWFYPCAWLNSINYITNIIYINKSFKKVAPKFVDMTQGQVKKVT